MAVTIHQTPQDFTPSDNPVTWTFSSDQTAQPNFGFLVEVYINNILVANELVFLESGIYAKFDASAYASNACGIPSISGALMEDAANNALVKIKVIELYGDPPAEQGSLESANITVWKARLDDDDFVDWDQSQYNALSGTAWLTNYPSNYNPTVRQQNEAQRLMAFTNLQTINLSVKIYDSNDAIIAQVLNQNIPNPPKIAIFNFTPGIIAGNTPLNISDWDDAAYYTVETNIFEVFRIDMSTAIDYDYRRRVHFLSELGSIESFTFELISRHSARVKSHGFRRSWGEWNGSDFEYTKTEGRDVDFAKVSERMIVIESDWLFEDLQHWIFRNLYESPVVWEEVLIGGIAKGTHLRRRKIMQTAWADKYNKNDTLFKERITLGLPHKTSMVV